MLRVMERRNFPVSSLRLLASPRSSGKTLTFRGESHTIKPLNMNSFEDIDIAIFSAGGAISRDFAPEAVRHGAVVVDNSSAFRMHADVPLVVPEINGADVKNHKGILANPNCTTAITLLARGRGEFRGIRTPHPGRRRRIHRRTTGGAQS